MRMGSLAVEARRPSPGFLDVGETVGPALVEVDIDDPTRRAHLPGELESNVRHPAAYVEADHPRLDAEAVEKWERGGTEGIRQVIQARPVWGSVTDGVDVDPYGGLGIAPVGAV